MSLENIQTCVKDIEAKFHIGDGIEGMSSNTVVRKWESVMAEKVEEAVQYLQLYTSVQNGTTKSMSVSFLTIDKTTLEGIWRGGKVSRRREDNGKYTIFQELHEGFVQTVNRTYVYQITHGTEVPDLTDLRFYDSGIDVGGNDVFYGENDVYARWTDPTRGDIITVKEDIGEAGNIQNYFSITSGVLTGNGDWTGTATIGAISVSETDLSEFLSYDGHLWHSGAKQTVLKLPNVDPAKEEDIREELQANEYYDSLSIKYETISGTNYYLDSRPVSEDDGSLSILLILNNHVGQEADIRAVVGDRITSTKVVLNDLSSQDINAYMESTVCTTDGRILKI